MKISDIIWELIDVNKKYFKELKQRRTISHQTKYGSDDIYQLVHDSGNICFVLSTGRCGTKLFTKIFENHPDVLAFHQPVPELIHFNKYAYQNYRSKDERLREMIDIARYEYTRKAFLLDKHYVETNNSITFFAHQLAKLYPNSKFIHLIRHPVAFVQSGYSRGWYEGNIEYDETKIRPIDEDDINWEQLPSVGKIAWLWNETNSFIDEFKKELPGHRVMTIVSETLFQDAATTADIFKFLNLTPLQDSIVDKLLARKVNKQQNQIILKPVQIEEVLSNTPLRNLYFKD